MTRPGRRSPTADFVVVQDLFLTDCQTGGCGPTGPAFHRAGRHVYLRRAARAALLSRCVPSLGTRCPIMPSPPRSGSFWAGHGGRFPFLVMAAIAASYPIMPGFPICRWLQVAEQWPIVGRSDLYYGGTTYENSAGSGSSAAPSHPQGKPVSLGWPAAARGQRSEARFVGRSR